MTIATILVKGEVQGVGYRGVVFKLARKLTLSGFVENVKPYDVRIIAEGEKKNLDEFIDNTKTHRGEIEELYLFSSVENPKSQYIPILPNKSQTPILPTTFL